jgi:hypothetical protein
MTYAAACASNWPRPTCRSCQAPCAYDREFRATWCCGACYDEQPLIIHRKEMLCRTKSPS